MPLDGISLRPMIEGKMTQRPVPIAFLFRDTRALNTNQYKLVSSDNGKTYELYDLIADKYEKNNIASANPDIVSSMKKTLETFVASCENSNKGNDY